MTTPVDFDRIIAEETPQAEAIAKWMAIQHRHARILDVGCGPGIYVQKMVEAGLDVWGVDGDPRMGMGIHPAIRHERLAFADVTAPHIPIPLPVSGAHVILSLEVGEHILDDRANLYGVFLARYAWDWLYFSAAHPGQGGEGHINCRPKAYWCELLQRCGGFWFHPEATEMWLAFMGRGVHMGWLAQNGMVFRRGDAR